MERVSIYILPDIAKSVAKPESRGIFCVLSNKKHKRIAYGYRIPIQAGIIIAGKKSSRGLVL
jgi:hypothetical protein